MIFGIEINIFFIIYTIFISLLILAILVTLIKMIPIVVQSKKKRIQGDIKSRDAKSFEELEPNKKNL